MIPAKPPPPTPSKLPFQPVAGIHTSILSAGATVICTRQKAGREIGLGAFCAPAGAGGVNGPAGTAVAAVMVVSGNFNDDNVAHAWLPEAAAAGPTQKNAVSTRAHNPPKILIFIPDAPW